MAGKDGTDCVNNIMQAIGQNTLFTKEEVAEVVESMKRIDKSKRATIAKKMRQKSAQEIADLAKAKADEIAKRVELMGKLKQWEGNPEAKGNKIFKALIHGADESLPGGNHNVYSIAKGYKNYFLNLATKLFKDMPEAVLSGARDAEIARAHDILIQGGKIDGLDPEIQRAVQGIHKLYKEFRTTANSSGMAINERLDYLGRHTHNAARVADVSADDWVNRVIPLLDQTEPFYGEFAMDDNLIRKKLAKVYEDIRSGHYMNESVGFSGGKRTIKFKDEASWELYNKDFGHGSIIDTMVASITSGSKQMAITQIFGRNYEKGFKFVEDQAMKNMSLDELKAFNDDTAGPFAGAKFERDVWKKHLFEGAGNPKDNLGSTILMRIAQMNSWSMLGNTVISSTTDIAFTSQALRAFTDLKIPEFDAVPKFFELVVDSKEREWLAQQFWFETDNLLYETHDRMGSFDDLPKKGAAAGGMFDKANRLIMSTTGLSVQAKASDLTATSIFASRAGNELDKAASWSNLSDNFRAAASRVGLTEADFGNLKKSLIKSEKHGNFLLTPDMAYMATKDAKLASKVSSALEFMRTLGKPEGSVLDKQRLTLGYKQDTTAHGLLSLLTQFKGYALGANRALRRIANANPNAKPIEIMGKYRITGELQSYAATMTYATILAGMGIIAKDALKNKKTNVKSKEFMVNALMDGAMPMQYDYMARILMGEYAKQGARQKSFLIDLAGPTARNIDEAVEFLSGAMSKKDKRWGPTLSKLWSKAPVFNTFWAKALLEYAFNVDMHEYVNPGYNAKMKMRMYERGEAPLF